jgi:soluble lytic murein transglycosylase-like protein
MNRLFFRYPHIVQSALFAALLWGGTGVCVQAEQQELSLENALALRNEARRYELGEGVKREPAKAIHLYCELARLGDAEAQYRLGWIHANARGIPRDDAMAAYFFAMAARTGHAQAQRMLKQVGEPVKKPPECLFDSEGRDIVAQGTQGRRKIADMVLKLAPEYGVYPRLAMAVIRTESNFNPGAVSPRNAQGLMQLIPETAERFNVKKPFDPEQNIRGGLAYLRWLLAYFKGDVTLVAAAYNAGEGSVNRHAGIPPYAETQSYVKRIRELFKRDEHPYDPAITDPSPELHRIASRRL